MYSTSALQPLVEIRRLLDEFISSETILIGHALENDLKTLRMVHFRNVDTAAIFRHPAGPPYRRALRDLYDSSLKEPQDVSSNPLLCRVKEHLGRSIQTGGANVGHSSLEDSVATLDLVKWHVINKPPPPPVRTPKAPQLTAAPAASTSASADAPTPVATPANREEQRLPQTADDIPF